MGRRPLTTSSVKGGTQTTSRHLLVLLDLNMPVLDGYQVLQRMKADERTKHIPVIILTTTDDPREVSKCYELGCNVYITKPVDYEQFAEAMRKLGLFLLVVMIPDGGQGGYGAH
jgi:CheY-like chemotaxis protein